MRRQSTIWQQIKDHFLPKDFGKIGNICRSGETPFQLYFKQLKNLRNCRFRIDNDFFYKKQISYKLSNEVNVLNSMKMSMYLMLSVDK